jgi:hypothetical protein
LIGLEILYTNKRRRLNQQAYHSRNIGKQTLPQSKKGRKTKFGTQTTSLSGNAGSAIDLPGAQTGLQSAIRTIYHITSNQSIMGSILNFMLTLAFAVMLLIGFCDRNDTPSPKKQEGPGAPKPFNPPTRPSNNKQVDSAKSSTDLQNQLSAPCDHFSNAAFNACNYRQLRPFVLEVINTDHTGTFNIEQACDVFSYLYKNWTYVSDPEGEDYVAPATESWELLSGDCDDFSTCIATALRAIGGEVAISSVATAAGRHAYAELAVKKTDVPLVTHYLAQRFKTGKDYRFRFRTHGGLVFLNLDYSAEHPGGPYPQGEIEGTILYLNKKYCTSY